MQYWLDLRNMVLKSMTLNRKLHGRKSNFWVSFYVMESWFQTGSIESIFKLAMPSCRDQLRSLLGTLTHYGLFCKNFSAIARPLYNLLKTTVKGNGLTVTQSVRTLLDSFSKGEIVCYDQKKAIICVSDASKNGLGFVLAHDIHQKEIVWLGK